MPTQFSVASAAPVSAFRLLIIFLFVFRNAFVSTVKRLSLLRDSNIAHVVACCTQDEPLCVLSEFTEYGDLCQFLRSHHHQPQHSQSQSQHYSNANDLNTSLSSSGGGSSGGSPTGLKYETNTREKEL